MTRRPTAEQIARARRKLESALGSSRVLAEPDACAAYGGDESGVEPRTPDLVALAESSDHLRAALRIAGEEEVPILARGGGTGKTGGAVPLEGGIVVATQGLNRIKDVDHGEGLVVVEPGVVLAELHRAVEAEGWFYPPDPNSVVGCALGGNVAENAGGPRAFRYGVTGDYVLGVEAFLVGGARLQVGRRTVKGVTGYDVAHLLVGSEGTLAVFGDLVLRLIPKPAEVRTLLALFSDARGAANAVGSIVRRGCVPRCLELMDAATLQAMRDDGNDFDSRAGALLIIEVDGDPPSCELQAQRVMDACADVGGLSVQLAKDEAERERLWASRRQMSNAVRKLSRHKVSEDVVVPRQQIPRLLELVWSSCEKLGLRTLSYGHAGDGNLHVNFLWDHDEELPKVDAAIAQLFSDTLSLGGTLTGEHGIGMLKAPFLPLEQSAELLTLQRGLKDAFDPKGLLNPGKIFSSEHHRAC